jgi:hypothetical protein
VRKSPFTNDQLDALRTVGDPRLDEALLDQELGKVNPSRYLTLARESGLASVFEADLGDPWAESISTVLRIVEEDCARWLKDLEAKYDLDPEYACGQIDTARALFRFYGEEISAALLLAGFAEMYATAWGSRVLVANGQLETHVGRRVRQTAIFVTKIMADPRAPHGREEMGDGDLVMGTSLSSKTGVSSTAASGSDGTAKTALPEEFCWRINTLKRECAALRLFHYVIRSHLCEAAAGSEALKSELGSRNIPTGDKKCQPINVEDLLGTLLTFSVTSFRILEAFGISWSPEDQEAYLFFWDLVGALLGIDHGSSLGGDFELPAGWITIRPPNVADASRLLTQLHTRQWLPVQQEINSCDGFQWDPFAPGRRLKRDLIETIEQTMPAMRRSWPEIVMRELALDDVRYRLSLDRTGMAWYVFDAMTQQQSPISPAMRRKGSDRWRARLLRIMAIEVAGRAMVEFLDSDSSDS